MPDEKPARKAAPESETKSTDPEKKKDGDKRTKTVAEKKAAETPGDEPLATEKPPSIQPIPPTSLLVLEIDNKTGLATKIEHFDEKTGERKEFTEQEYALVYPFGRPVSRRAVPTAESVENGATKPRPDSSTGRRPGRQSARALSSLKGRRTLMAIGASPPERAALIEAYYRGVSDYIRTLASSQ